MSRAALIGRAFLSGADLSHANLSGAWVAKNNWSKLSHSKVQPCPMSQNIRSRFL